MNPERDIAPITTIELRVLSASCEIASTGMAPEHVLVGARDSHAAYRALQLRTRGALRAHFEPENFLIREGAARERRERQGHIGISCVQRSVKRARDR